MWTIGYDKSNKTIDISFGEKGIAKGEKGITKAFSIKDSVPGLKISGDLLESMIKKTVPYQENKELSPEKIKEIENLLKEMQGFVHDCMDQIAQEKIKQEDITHFHAQNHVQDPKSENITIYYNKGSYDNKVCAALSHEKDRNKDKRFVEHFKLLYNPKEVIPKIVGPKESLDNFFKKVETECNDLKFGRMNEPAHTGTSRPKEPFKGLVR